MQNKNVAIVACSNGLAANQKDKIEHLKDTLMGINMIPILSTCLYAKESVFSGSGKERADVLMNFYEEEEIENIFDVSGGDLANEVLPYLNYDVIKKSDKLFWGYSDLTTVLNAIYTKCGKSSVLFQVRNLISEFGKEQIKRFGTDEMYDFKYKFMQGKFMEGTVVGGNIRCLLKLAGTEYWPDMTGKILFLEAMSGKVPQMVTYLNQLKQLGVFEKVNGVLLGTFTQMEQEACEPDMTDLVKRYVSEKLPIAKTQEIGHGTNSKALVIGKEYILNTPECALKIGES